MYAAEKDLDSQHHTITEKCNEQQCQQTTNISNARSVVHPQGCILSPARVELPGFKEELCQPTTNISNEFPVCPKTNMGGGRARGIHH